MDPIERLRGAVAGPVVGPGDAGFDDARRVWNGMIDRQPVAVVRAASVADIAPTIAAARESGLPLAVRGGGHNVAGNGTVDGGVVLDLGGLTDVVVDVAARTVTVAPGATLGDLDRATEPHGLAVPVGVVSGTGVAGLTLGGGVGWLTRPYGLSIDNLVSVDLITATGETVRASATEEPELFWGLSGGGGNFGVVASFTFRAYPLGPEVFAGTFIFGQERIPDVLRAWGDWCASQPPDAITTIATFIAPPPEFEMGDAPLMLLGWAWASEDRTAGEAAVEDLRRATRPDTEAVAPIAWTAWQSAADLLFPKGVRAYWKNTSFDRLDVATIEVIARRAGEQIWQGTAFDIHHMGGAFARVPEGATAFPDRSATYWLNIYGFWPDASDDPARIAFVRGFAADMEPHAAGGQYVNFLGHEGESDPRADALAVYGETKLERLIALKRRFDPDNVFRLNHNIPPD
jgi:FAD/FMN-containing dehydrogenase